MYTINKNNDKINKANKKMQKIFKLLKYSVLSTLVFMVSFLLKQENSPDYSFTNLVHKAYADTPHTTDSTDGFSADSTTDSDGAPSTGDIQTDGFGDVFG